MPVLFWEFPTPESASSGAGLCSEGSCKLLIKKEEREIKELGGGEVGEGALGPGAVLKEQQPKVRIKKFPRRCFLGQWTK